MQGCRSVYGSETVGCSRFKQHEPSTEPEAAGLWAQILETRWALEWMEKDLALALVEGRPKDWVKAVAGALGRSHRCLIRMADQAAKYPAEYRRMDRSPRWQVAQQEAEADTPGLI